MLRKEDEAVVLIYVELPPIALTVSTLVFETVYPLKVSCNEPPRGMVFLVTMAKVTVLRVLV